MTNNPYKCDNHKLDIICHGCVKAWIARHDAMMEFLLEMIVTKQDRDDYFEALQDDARKLLKEMDIL